MGEDKKGRPKLTFSLDSPQGGLLLRNFKTEGKLLFKTNKNKVEKAFNSTIGKALAEGVGSDGQKFIDHLPLAIVKESTGKEILQIEKPVTTMSAIRAIVPRYLREQYQIATDIIEAGMGHVQGSILQNHYTGIVPNKDLVERNASVYLQCAENIKGQINI